MKINHKLFLFFFYITLGFSNLIAQESALNILKKVKNNSLKLDNVYYKFSINSESENRFFPLNGEFYIQKNKYFIDTEDIDQIYDGENVFTIIHENKEVIVSGKNNTFFNFTPYQIFNFFLEGFNLSIENDKEKLIVKASNNSESNFIYFITINSVDLSIDKIEMIDYLTGRIENQFLTITYEYNIRVPSSLFKFDVNSYNNYLIVRQN